MKQHTLIYAFIIASTIFSAPIFAAEAPAERNPAFRVIGDKEINGSYVYITNPDQKQIAQTYEQMKKFYDRLSPENRGDLMEPTPVQTKRLLSCTGGGTKGLIPAVMLAYLEEVMNTPLNDNARKIILQKLNRSENDYLYISDLFDAAAGTSTGGILAAGLMFNAKLSVNDAKETRYTAIEIAQVYARYCDILFGISTINTLTGSSLCDVQPLEDLLSIYFGDIQMQKAFKDKHLEVFSCDTTANTTPVCLSVDGDFKGIMVKTSVRSTTSVPWLYPASTVQCGERHYAFQDGGLRTNFPGSELLRHQQNKNNSSFYELYAFGTGHSEKENDDDESILKRLKCTLIGPVGNYEYNARKSCEEAVEGPGNPLTFFAHMNPKLSPGMHLASSGPEFVKKAIQSAFKEIATESFKIMVKQLGFELPSPLDEMTQIVKEKLEALDYEMLMNPDHIEGNVKDRKTQQKELLLNYIERQIETHKNYDFLVRGYCFVMKNGVTKKLEGNAFKEFLQHLVIISKNEKFKTTVNLYLESVDKLTAVTPIAQNDWDFLINQADHIVADATQLKGSIEIVRKSSSKETLPEDASTPKIPEAKDEKLLEAEPCSNEEYSQKLDCLLNAYITFLDNCEHKAYNSIKTPLLADLFLSKYLENISIENIQTLESIKKIIWDLIASAKSQDATIAQVGRFIAWFVGMDAGGTRWTELYNGLERYKQARELPVEIKEQDDPVASTAAAAAAA
ncbi:MAG: patatin-like phospholipase family protein [Proteobacteria bacterium]|nr:patatin-like phospholipase family protein [Pseudomonadota bacterium]